jgi:hypothetical protein
MRQPRGQRSSTSETRIRIPRTHGRPPHWSMFTVMRSTATMFDHPSTAARRGSARRTWRGNVALFLPLMATSRGNGQQNSGQR